MQMIHAGCEVHTHTDRRHSTFIVLIHDKTHQKEQQAASPHSHLYGCSPQLSTHHTWNEGMYMIWRGQCNCNSYSHSVQASTRITATMIGRALISKTARHLSLQAITASVTASWWSARNQRGKLNVKCASAGTTQTVSSAELKHQYWQRAGGCEFYQQEFAACCQQQIMSPLIWTFRIKS